MTMRSIALLLALPAAAYAEPIQKANCERWDVLDTYWQPITHLATAYLEQYDAPTSTWIEVDSSSSQTLAFGSWYTYGEAWTMSHAPGHYRVVVDLTWAIWNVGMTPSYNLSGAPSSGTTTQVWAEFDCAAHRPHITAYEPGTSWPAGLAMSHTFTTLHGVPNEPIVYSFESIYYIPGASLNPNTGVLTWTPTGSQIGLLYPAILIATDTQGQSDRLVFMIVVKSNPGATPSITSDPPGIATPGQLYTYRVTAVDPNGGPITFTLDGGPAGMSIHPTTGVLTWTPSSANIGTNVFQVRATDNQSLFAKQYRTITTGNTAVVQWPSEAAVGQEFVSIGGVVTGNVANRKGNTWSEIDMTIGWSGTVAGNASANRLNVEGTVLGEGRYNTLAGWGSIEGAHVTPIGYPLGITFPHLQSGSSNSSHVTVAAGVTQALAQGTYGILTLNAGSSSNRAILRLTGGRYDFEKAILGAYGKVECEGACELRVKKTYQATNNHTLAPAPGAPIGAHEVIMHVAYVSGSSGYAVDLGTSATIKARITAKDAIKFRSGTGEGTFVADLVHIDGGTFVKDAGPPPNNAPSLTSTPITTATEDALYTYDVNGTDPDAGDTLTFSLTSAPTGMTIDAATGVISFTPDNGHVGTNAVTVRVTDAGGLYASQSYTLTVANTNDPPSISGSPATSVNENASYSYAPTGTDPDTGDTLTFSLSAAPPGMTIDPSSGLVSWLPTPANLGPHSVTIVLTDAAGATDTQPFTVTVLNVNDPPTFVSTPVTTALEDQPYTYTARATDPDAGDTSTYALTTAPTGMTIAASGAITWTPDNAAVGSHTVTVRATDAGGLIATQTFTIAVQNTNDPPAFTSTPPVSATEGSSYSYDASATDPDPSDVLTFSLDSAPSGMTISSGSGVVAWTPSSQQVGSFSVVIRVSDNAGGIDVDPFSIAVANVNDPPAFVSSPITSFLEDQAYQYLARATDPDPQDTLTYSLGSAPAGMIIQGGLVTWTPPANLVGAFPVSITAADAAGLSSSQSFSLTIMNVNDPPIFTSAPPSAVDQHQLYSYTAVASDPDAGDVLTFTLTQSPPGMVVDTAGVVTFTPSATQVGSFAVTIRVTDASGAADTESFTITVTNVNDPPSFTSTPPNAGAENQLYSYDASASDPDAGDTFTFSLFQAPSGMAVAPQTGFVTWVPGTTQAGSHPVTMRVTDAAGASADQSFTVDVTSAGAPCGPGSTEARCSAMAWSFTLDQDGVVLGAVDIEEMGPLGTRYATTDPGSGLATLGGGPAGAYEWTFSSSGYAPVFRRAALVEESIAWVSIPRLSALDDLFGSISPSGTTFQDVFGRVDLTFAAGAVSTPAQLVAAVLDAQSLPAHVPPGWSPASAIWYEVFGPLVTNPTATFLLPAPLASPSLVLASFDPASGEWIALANVTAASPTDPNPMVTVSLGAPGGYALLVADDGAAAPPVPALGSALGASPIAPPAFDTLAVAGEVIPEWQIWSTNLDDITGIAHVTATGAQPLPSGIVLPARLFERYVFQATGSTHLPVVDLGIALHRYPMEPGAPAGSLSTRFRVRPRFVLGATELADVHQDVDVLASLAFEGRPIDAAGGTVSTGPITLTFPGGAFAEATLVSLTTLPTEAIDDAVLGFRVDWSGSTVPAGTQIGFFTSELVTESTSYVLARKNTNALEAGFAPVARFESDAIGQLALNEPPPNTLPGITIAGTYALFAVGAPQGLVRGVVQNALSSPIAGALVTTSATQWQAVTDTLGRFDTLGIPGTVDLFAEHPPTADSGSTSGMLSSATSVLDATIVIGPQPPQVVRIVPADTSTGVSVVASIEVFFSEPLLGSSVTSTAVTLTTTTAIQVAGSQSLRPNRRSIAFFPTNPLAHATQYTIHVDPSVTDIAAMPLAPPTTFTFTTELLRVRPSGASQLTSWAPGSQTSPCSPYNPNNVAPDFDPTGLSVGVPGFDPSDRTITCVIGSAGVADPEVPVILVNEDRGFTATVLSQTNGSFKSFIRGSEEELLSAVFTNANGTQLTIPLDRQKFDDGSLALYASGGVVDGPNPVGNAPLEIVVEPGTIPRRSKFKLDGTTQAQTLFAAQGVAPLGGSLAFGASIAYDGPPLTKPVHFRFPVNVTNLSLPLGQAPESGGYVLTRVRPTTVEGQDLLLYETLDQLFYENGALVTRSELTNFASNQISTLGVVTMAFVYASAPHLMVGGLALACPIDMSCPAVAASETDVHPFVRLQGALIFARPITASTGGAQPPAVSPNPGELAAFSGITGHFSLTLVNQVDYTLHGLHPALPGARGTGSAFGELSHVIFTNQGETGVGAPAVRASHTPERPLPWTSGVTPGPNEQAIVEVIAEYAGSGPLALTHTHRVVSLGAPVTSTSAVVTVLEQETPIGPNQWRSRYGVTCRAGALVQLELTAVADGRTTRLTYPVVFGAAAPPPTNDVASPEPNDRTGPMVVQSVPPNTGLVPLGRPITLHFDEPISSRIRIDRSPIALIPPAGDPIVSLSADQRQLDLSFAGLKPSTSYTLTLTRLITDLASPPNPLDQDPRTPAADAYTLAFRTQGLVDSGPGQFAQGAGSIVHGAYAFVIERYPPSSLVVLDVSNPLKPSPVARVPIPGGSPRDLVMIPGYSYVRANGPCTVVETAWSSGLPPSVPSACAGLDREILAVVGGAFGVAAPKQSLTLFDVTNAGNPRIILTTPLTFDPYAVTSHLQWSPPYLAYLERSSGVSSINVVNLQKLIFSHGLSQAQLDAMPCAIATPTDSCPSPVPLSGTPGADANGDGDYVDANEQLPLPSRPFGGIVGLGFGGKELTLTPNVLGLGVPNPGPVGGFPAGFIGDMQDILDYDLDTRGPFVGVVLDGGLLPDLTPLNPSYRTLAIGGLSGSSLSSQQASYPIPAGYPRSVGHLARQPIRVRTGTIADLEHGGQRVVLDVAVVGARDYSTGENRLFLLDVTNAQPALIGPTSGIHIPDRPGAVFGSEIHQIERHPLMPSVLRVFTSRDIVLLDIDRLTMNAPAGAPHPAILGVLPDVGTTLEAHGASAHGVHVLAQDGRVVFIGPQLYFVSFPEAASLPNLGTWLNQPTPLIRSALNDMLVETDLRPARLRAEGSRPSELAPVANPAKHFFVLVHAPGGAGTQIDVMLEGLDEVGRPLPNPVGPLAPVRAAKPTTLTTAKLDPTSESANVQPFPATRLSSNPSSPYYNLYVSNAFALVYDDATTAELSSLQVHGGHPRLVLFGGYGLRASIEPGVATTHVLSTFASAFSGERIEYGSSVEASAYPGYRALGPNPKSVRGSASAPGTEGMIAAHNGALELGTIDLSVPGVAFARSFVGQDHFHGPFGPGFDFGYNQRLIELDPDNIPQGMEIGLVLRGGTNDSVAGSGDVLLEDGTGTIVRFDKFSGSGVPSEYATDPLILQLGWPSQVVSWYLPEKGVFDALVRFASGQFARLTPSGAQFWYSASGRLQKIYSRYENNRTELIYGGDGKLRRIVDRSFDDRFIDVGYYGKSGAPYFETGLDVATTAGPHDGRIARLKDDLGRDVVYKYDAHGRLETFEDVDVKTTRGTGAFRGRRKTMYAWGSGDSITSVTDGSGPALSPGEMRLSFSTGSGGVIASATGYQGTTTIVLTHVNEAQALAGGTAKTTITTFDQAQTVYTFDAFGLPAKVEESGLLAASRSSESSYTPDLLIASVTHPKKNREAYEYHSGPNLRSRANLRRVDLDPGAAGGGNPVFRDIPTYDERYNLPSGAMTEIGGDTVLVALENGGRDIGSQTYLGTSIVQVMTHDSVTGQLTLARDPNGVESTFHHDASGFLDSHTSGGVTTTFGYGACKGGRLGSPCAISRVDFADLFEHDELGRTISRNRSGFLEEIARNQNGDVVEIQRQVGGGLSYRETRKYDQQGFLLELTQLDVETNGAPATYSWTYAPDTMKRLASITAPGDGATTSYVYDYLARVHEMTRGDYTKILEYDLNGNLDVRRIGTAEQRFRYNGFDDLIGVTDAEGGELSMAYSDRGDLASQVVTDLYGTLADVGILTDPIGRPTSVRSAASTSTIDHLPSVREILTTGPKGATHSLRYDLGGRADSSRIPGLTEFDFDRDGSGRVVDVAQIEGQGTNFGFSLRYDPRSSVDRIDDSKGRALVELENRLDGLPTAVRVSPDDLDLRTETPRTRAGESLGRITPTGVETRVQHDEHRRMSRVGPITGPANAGRRFTFDDTDRLTTVRYPDNSEMTFSGFDARNRPGTISLPGNGTIAALWDLEGRLVDQTSTFGNYTDHDTFAVDALSRVRATTFDDGSSFGGSMTHDFSLLGVLNQTTLTSSSAGAFRWSMTHDALGAPASVVYPSNAIIDETRSNVGRLESMGVRGEAPLVTTIDYASATEPGTLGIGPGGFIQRSDVRDHRHRLLGRRYTTSGAVVGDLRYAYDDANREVAMQKAHEGGRTSFYRYDDDSRLIRAEVDARPSDGILGAWNVDTNGIAGSWAAGDYGRTFDYHPTEDRVQSVTTDEWLANAAAAAPPNVGSTFANVDSSGFLVDVDGFTRTRDALGNTTTLETDSGVSTLEYDARSRLRRVTREDGCVITYRYRSDGMLLDRTVNPGPGACVPSTTAFVYDGMLLLETYDIAVSPRQLTARYYYAGEGDIPLAADFWDGASMRRHYFMVDRQGSIIGVLDDNGDLVEKTSYDPWGTPRVEPRDTEPPEVAYILGDTNGDVLVVLTEPVITPLPSTATTTLQTLLPSLTGLVDVEDVTGASLATSVRFDPSYPGYPTGSVIRMTTAVSVGGPPFNPDTTPAPTPGVSYTLVIADSAVQDYWANPIVATSIPFPYGVGVLYVGSPIGSTSVVTLDRSTIGNVLTFQSHLFDPDANLLLMRARAFDPRTGSFVSPDQEAYRDSSSLYAGMAWDPINNRDPTGRLVIALPAALTVLAAGGLGALAGTIYYAATTDCSILGEGNCTARAVGTAFGAVAGVLPSLGIAEAEQDVYEYAGYEGLREAEELRGGLIDPQLEAAAGRTEFVAPRKHIKESTAASTAVVVTAAGVAINLLASSERLAAREALDEIPTLPGGRRAFGWPVDTGAGYDPELLHRAAKLRRETGLLGYNDLAGRNVASAKVRIQHGGTESTRFITRANTPGTDLHSEGEIARVLERLRNKFGKSNVTVEELLTEREPCGSGAANCVDVLRQLAPEARVFVLTSRGGRRAADVLREVYRALGE